MNKEEFISKLKGAKSADDIIALAKENGIEIAPDKAQELFGKLNSVELSDDQLQNVAGGWSMDDEIIKIIESMSGVKLINY